MFTVEELLTHLAPMLTKAAEWDPVGLQLGDPIAPLGRIGVCHEVSSAVLAEAEARRIDTLVGYHPLLFSGVTALVAGNSPEGRAWRLIRNGMSLVVVHTAWDAAPGGTADALADTLGLTEVAVPDAEHPGAAFCRVGELATPMTGADFAASAAERVGAHNARIAGDTRRPVSRVLVAAGAGADMPALAREVGADTVVTADVSHHRAVAAVDAGLAVIDLGHAASERPGMRALVDWVPSIVGAPVEDLTGTNTDPWERV